MPVPASESSGAAFRMSRDVHGRFDVSAAADGVDKRIDGIERDHAKGRAFFFVDESAFETNHILSGSITSPLRRHGLPAR